MKTRLFLILFAWLPSFNESPLLATEQESARAERALALSIVNTRIQDIHPDQMGSDEHSRLVTIFRREEPYFIQHLIRLRDEVTIEESIAKWEAAAGQNRQLRQKLEQSASPWLLPRLAAFLYRDEPTQQRSYYEGLEDMGFSHLNSMVMRRNLLDAPEIPESAKAWAREFDHPYESNPALLGRMRVWWEVNSENLEKERYDLLIPPPAETPTPVAVVSPPPEPRAQPPSPVAPPEPKQAVNAPASPHRPWLWGIAILLAGTLFAVAFKKRR